MKKEKLGSFLRHKRIEAGYTVKELSKKTGLSVGYLYHLEEGYRKPGNFALTALDLILNL